MGTSYGNTGGSGLIFWTAEYHKNVICFMYNTVYKYVFSTHLPLCSVQISRLYFRVYLFDNCLCPMRPTVKKCHFICIRKQYRDNDTEAHNQRQVRHYTFEFAHTRSCIKIHIIARRSQAHTVLLQSSLLYFDFEDLCQLFRCTLQVAALNVL